MWGQPLKLPELVEGGCPASEARLKASVVGSKYEVKITLDSMCGISRTNHPANSAPSFLPKLLALLHPSRLLGLKNDSGPKERNPDPDSSANSNDHRSNLRLLPQTQSD